MSQVTSFSERTRASLREQLLDAATDLLPERGYARLRMADVATKVGVSRQTVYNEFGSKSALVQAVALRTTAEFLEGIQQRHEAAPDVLTGIFDATVFTIEHARENRLVAAVLGTEVAEDLVPLLTTRGEPILRAATEVSEAHLRDRLPGLGDPAFVAETMVRLTLSHLVLQTCPATEVASDVRTVIAALIRSSTVSNRSD
ncbi:TetR family transcriptional regulator [Prauserella marina]|uniref:DNA-binding transcriptional regulator, AcrR family n=1 Tax=Prauserella marina TaxID=530584 RepID=A0A222VW99_9PSEU|nr:TetR family transcriptional regulator [Prauserella marina]ASR38208.1 TetR family transcriptional regulator [Prauserella marina]PWV78607.1 TetR family transcriptional regulator [Prauserella marina]SDC89830.1 DNA-binding transcriptional regulator, AcrR family [Prauserella marina]